MAQSIRSYAAGLACPAVTFRTSRSRRSPSWTSRSRTDSSARVRARSTARPSRSAATWAGRVAGTGRRWSRASSFPTSGQGNGVGDAEDLDLRPGGDEEPSGAGTTSDVRGGTKTVASEDSHAAVTRAVSAARSVRSWCSQRTAPPMNASRAPEGVVTHRTEGAGVARRRAQRHTFSPSCPQQGRYGVHAVAP